MAALVLLGLVVIIAGTCLGALLRLSFAIRGEDRGQKWGLRLDAPTDSAQAARKLVGFTSSGCE